MEVIKFRKIGDVNITLLSFWEAEDDTDVSYELRITEVMK